VKVLLVCNGPLDGAAVARLRAEATAADLVVGVDGGAVHLIAHGIVPDVVTGDFDSLDAETLAGLEARGVRVVPTPDQEFNDLDKALAYALREREAGSVRVHGATGGRLDHVYSALSTLLKYAAEDVRLVDGVGETWALAAAREATLRGDDLPGRVLSLMALGRVTGVHTTGVRWPLHGEELAPGHRDGTLNVITEPTVTISVEEGDLLVMLHHGDDGSPPSAFGTLTPRRSFLAPPPSLASERGGEGDTE
jgi:thiamine pyrophosphokinase